jgi:hypothetical protein
MYFIPRILFHGPEVRIKILANYVFEIQKKILEKKKKVLEKERKIKKS